MKVSDFVKLTNDNKELKAKNIYKGMGGVLLVRIEISDEWIVKFLDDNNYGAYAVAKVKAKDLRYSSEYPDELLPELMEQIDDPKTYTHTELKLPKFKEYDKVMLIRDKSRYEKEGVKKGMTGCVLSSYAIQNEWEVIFSVPEWEVPDPDICVHEDDLELVNR